MKQCKINITHLSRRKNNVTSRPIPGLPTPWVLSSAGKLLWYLRSYLLPNHLFNVLFLWYFPLFYLPSLSIYSRSANIRPVHSNWALSSLYHYKTRPLTADWLQVCFGTRSDTVVKSVFQILLSAPLRQYSYKKTKQRKKKVYTNKNPFRKLTVVLL